MAAQPETPQQKVDRLKREIRDVQRAINNVAVEVYGPAVEEALAHINKERAKLGIAPAAPTVTPPNARRPTDLDVNEFKTCYGLKNTDPGWPACMIYDINMDGAITGADLNALLIAYKTGKLTNFPAPPH